MVRDCIGSCSWWLRTNIILSQNGGALTLKDIPEGVSKVEIGSIVVTTTEEKLSCTMLSESYIGTRSGVQW